MNTTSGWYDTFFRGYDPALGRFHQVDPKAIADHNSSPYNYVDNNPISFNDRNGDLKVYRDPANPDTWAPNPQFGDPFSDGGGGPSSNDGGEGPSDFGAGSITVTIGEYEVTVTLSEMADSGI